MVTVNSLALGFTVRVLGEHATAVALCVLALIHFMVVSPARLADREDTFKVLQVRPASCKK